MYRIPDTENPIIFPEDYTTTPEGLLAVGGNLHPETLIDAYSKGVFPWYSDADPILWWHPDPRLVILPKNVHISRKMCRLFNKSRPLYYNKDQLDQVENAANISAEIKYLITINKDFSSVITQCAISKGPRRDGTWIMAELKKSFIKLHKAGFAHSVEVYNRRHELVGGLYGLSIGTIFFGESMFSLESNTSKLALFWLCQFLKQHDFKILDCQVVSPHLLTLGAEAIQRAEFLKHLKEAKTFQKNPARVFKQLCNLDWS